MLIASQSEERGCWPRYVTGCNSLTEARRCEIDLAVAAPILSFLCPLLHLQFRVLTSSKWGEILLLFDILSYCQ
jgi:hypothetical protein